LLSREFKNSPGNRPSLGFVQLRQFCNNVCCTHEKMITEPMKKRNPMPRP
jgi:hypothetical protein